MFIPLLIELTISTVTATTYKLKIIRYQQTTNLYNLPTNYWYLLIPHVT